MYIFRIIEQKLVLFDFGVLRSRVGSSDVVVVRYCSELQFPCSE